MVDIKKILYIPRLLSTPIFILPQDATLSFIRFSSGYRLHPVQNLLKQIFNLKIESELFSTLWKAQNTVEEMCKIMVSDVDDELKIRGVRKCLLLFGSKTNVETVCPQPDTAEFLAKINQSQLLLTLVSKASIINEIEKISKIREIIKNEKLELRIKLDKIEYILI